MEGSGLASDDDVDDLLGHVVGQDQVQAGDDHEADDHAGRLGDLPAVGPLYALELGPARAQEAEEADDAAMRRRAGRGLGAARRRRAAQRLALELGVLGLVGRGAALAARLVLVDLVLELGEALVGQVLRAGALVDGRVGDAAVTLDVGLSACAADERGLELVDLPREVVELTGRVGPAGLARRGRARLGAPGLALLGSLSITRHGAAPLAGLPVARVATAPAAVLAQRDAIGVVALGLVGLIVAPLAVLTGESHSDAHVSAGHLAAPWWQRCSRPT